MFVVGDDFVEFFAECWRGGRESAETAEGGQSTLWFPFHDEVTGCLGEIPETAGKDQCPESLDYDGNAVAAAVVTVVSCVVDNCGEEETEC